MPLLILIRHANPAIDPGASADEWPLSAEGRERARRFAAQVAAFRPQCIITSEEPKAAETGRILAAELALPCSSAPGLGEHDRRIVQWEADVNAFHRQVEQFFAQPDELVFGGETAEQAHRRFNQAVDAVLAEHPDENIAIVTHGTVMSLYISAHTGGDPFHLWWQLQQLGMPALVALETASGRLVAKEGLLA